MKRHISIFALLIGAFAAVGVARAETDYIAYWASSTHPFTIVNYDATPLFFDSYNKNSGGYYHDFGGDWDYLATDLNIRSGQCIEAMVPDGYKFSG